MVQLFMEIFICVYRDCHCKQFQHSTIRFAYSVHGHMNSIDLIPDRDCWCCELWLLWAQWAKLWSAITKVMLIQVQWVCIDYFSNILPESESVNVNRIHFDFHCNGSSPEMNPNIRLTTDQPQNEPQRMRKLKKEKEKCDENSVHLPD